MLRSSSNDNLNDEEEDLFRDDEDTFEDEEEGWDDMSDEDREGYIDNILRSCD